MPKTLSSRDAAKQLGIHPEHLLRLVRQGVLKPSQVAAVGKARMYGWTAQDVRSAKKILSTRKPGPKPKQGNRS